MGKLTDHQSAVTTKMLLIGNSGAGKTGSLASLAAAGYNLRIIDLDNGLDVLRNVIVSGPYGKTPDEKKEILSRIDFETITDPMKNQGGRMVPAKANVWNKVVKLLQDWPGFGNVETWGTQDVLVIDSLSFLCTAAMNFQLSMNGRLGGRVEQSDWYVAQQMIESMMQTLYDSNIKCNIVVLCHIQYIGDDGGPQIGYPATLGKALSPRIGRYFNSVLAVRNSGSGAGEKRKIMTRSIPMIELKNTAPFNVLPEYSLETGLADYFKAVRL